MRTHMIGSSILVIVALAGVLAARPRDTADAAAGGTEAAAPAVVKADDRSTAVELNVHMTREFVRSNSNLGAGAVAMGVLVGPFSRNIINLYVSVRDDAGAWQKIHEQQMAWGANSVKFVAPRGADLKLYLRVGGTRSGGAELGTLALTEADTHFYSVNLGEEGVKISGRQRGTQAPAATPAPAPSAADRLKELKSLKDQGILSDEEYEAKRKALVEKL